MLAHEGRAACRKPARHRLLQIADAAADLAAASRSAHRIPADNRTRLIRLSHQIDLNELREQLDHVRTLALQADE
jgi:hypothetical protein